MAFIRNQYGNLVYVPDYRTGGPRLDSNGYPVRGIGLDTTQTMGPVNPQDVGYMPPSPTLTSASQPTAASIPRLPVDAQFDQGASLPPFQEPTPIPDMPGYGTGYVNIGGGFDPQPSVGGTDIRDFIGGAGNFGYYGLPPSPSSSPFAGASGGGSIGTGYGGGSMSVGGNDISGFGLGNTGMYGGLPSPYGTGGGPTVDIPTSSGGGYYSGIPIYDDPFSASVYDASGGYQPIGSGAYDPFAGVGGGGEAHQWDFTGTPVDPWSEPGALPGTDTDPFAGATVSGDLGSISAPAGFGQLVAPPGLPSVSGGGTAAPMPTSSSYPSYQPGTYIDPSTGQAYQVTPDPATGGSIITPLGPAVGGGGGATGGFGVGSGAGFGVTPGGFSTGYTPFGGGGVGPQFSPGGAGINTGAPGGGGGFGGGGAFATPYMHGGVDPFGGGTGGSMPMPGGFTKPYALGEQSMPGTASDISEHHAIIMAMKYGGSPEDYMPVSAPYTPKGGKTSGIKAPSSGTLARAYNQTGSPRAL